MARQKYAVEEIEQVIEKGVEEIAITAHSLSDAAPRAARFLVRVAVLADFLKDIEDDMPRFQTQVNMTYAQAILVAEGKNITEKKTMAEADPAYNAACEQQGKQKAIQNWVKNHMENFNNAHVMYRQHSNQRG